MEIGPIDQQEDWSWYPTQDWGGGASENQQEEEPIDAIKGRKGDKGKGKGWGNGSWGKGKGYGGYGKGGYGKGGGKGGQVEFTTPFYRNCKGCGKIGHSVVYCPDLGKGFSGDCSKCGIRGHKAAICPSGGSPKGKGKANIGAVEEQGGNTTEMWLGGCYGLEEEPWGKDMIDKLLRKDPDMVKQHAESQKISMIQAAENIMKSQVLADEELKCEECTFKVVTHTKKKKGKNRSERQKARNEKEKEETGEESEYEHDEWIKKEVERQERLDKMIVKLEDNIKQVKEASNHLGHIGEIVKDHLGQEWEQVDVTVDSGAADHVSNKEIGKGIEVRETEASKKGMSYRVANGETIPNRGEKVLRGVTDTGKNIGFTAQITDVTKALCSVGKMTDSGNRVVFDDDDKEGNYIQNKASGEKTYFRKENGIYKVTMWMKAQDEKPNGQVFQRQGQ
jgi:hypothetical protein